MSGEAQVHDDHARRCDPRDFWRQVRRTVNGEPVPQGQIDLIVSMVNRELDIQPSDYLLDLCCGNGALTTSFFERCRGGHGVDYSSTLIDVAKKNFVTGTETTFERSDVVEYLDRESNPGRFNKVLCYGSFNYLSRESVADLLRLLRQRFSHVERFVIGNIADRDRMSHFFRDGAYVEGVEDRADSPIGIWWSRQQLADLCTASGWSARIHVMPSSYYAAHYRFDAVLTPA